MRGNFPSIGGVSNILGGQDRISCPLLRSSCTHIFQAAHKVVADWGAWQVSCVQAAPYVEEIIRAQHGVVLLSIASGGKNPIHQDRHLEDPCWEYEERKMTRHGGILDQTDRTGLITSCFVS